MSMEEKSAVHKSEVGYFWREKYPDGLTGWLDAIEPEMAAGRTTGRLRGCSFCGSMHPSDVAAAIKAGAVGSWADRKYGWPHKAYFDKIPNPHAGMPESRSSSSDPGRLEDGRERYPLKVQNGFNPTTGEPKYTYYEAPRPASATTSGKFYSVHLQDASPEDRAIIEQHLGVAFEFRDDGHVYWKPAGQHISTREQL